MENPYKLQELPELTNKPSLQELNQYAAISHNNYMHHEWTKKRDRLLFVLRMSTDEYLGLVNSLHPDGFYGLCR